MSNDITLLQEKIEVDLQFLLECLHEVLLELKEDGIAAIIPWRVNSRTPDVQVPTARTCQLYSIVFQLLGMAEENAAVQTRRVMESAKGSSYERGLWGNTLLRLKADGVAEKEVAASLGAVHIEPVLTALDH